MTKTNKRIFVAIFLVLLTIFVILSFVQSNYNVKADESENNTQILSEMSAEECYNFIIEQGVEIPSEFFITDELKVFVKSIIKYVEEYPGYPFIINYSVSLNFAEEIRQVVYDYYGIDENDIANMQTYSTNQLQDNYVQDINGNWVTSGGYWTDALYGYYNCYAYAIGQTERDLNYSGRGVQYDIGYFSNISYVFDSTSVDRFAEIVVCDLEVLGYYAEIYYNPVENITNNETLICLRKTTIVGKDCHFMKYNPIDDTWYHKPGGSAILKYKYAPDFKDWIGEGYYGAAVSYEEIYDSEIRYIVFSTSPINHQHTITLDYGYDNLTSTVQLHEGSSIQADSIPTRQGYTFDGFYSEKNGQGTCFVRGVMTEQEDGSFAMEPVSTGAVWSAGSDGTIYANWIPTVYTLTLDVQGGAGGTRTIEAIYGQEMPTVDAPIWLGREFLGYYSGTNGTGTKYYNADMTSAHVWNISSNTTLYAYWEVITYTITLIKQGGTGGDDTIEVQYEAPLPQNVEAPTRWRWTFMGYYDQPNGQGRMFYNANMEGVRNWEKLVEAPLYAYWTQESYTVTLDVQGGAGGTREIEVVYGYDMPKADAPIWLGYEFWGYYSEINGIGTRYYNSEMMSLHVWDIHSNKTLYAYWEIITFSLILDKQGGVGGDDTIEVNYDFAMPQNVEAPTRDGWLFMGYYDQPNGMGKMYYDADMVSVRNWDKLVEFPLYAYWIDARQDITLIINEEANEISHITVGYGEQIVVDFAPYREHYRFLGYYSSPTGDDAICYVQGVLSNSDPDGYYRIKPVSTSATWQNETDGTLYARWERLQADIECTIVKIGEEVLETPYLIDVVSGEQMQISAPEIEGYTFNSWTINDFYYTNSTITCTLTLHISYLTGEVTLYNPYHTGSAIYSDGYITVAVRVV